MGMRTMATVKMASFVTTPLVCQGQSGLRQPRGRRRRSSARSEEEEVWPPPAGQEFRYSREVCMAFWRGFCCPEMVRYAREGYPSTKHDGDKDSRD